MGIKRHSMTLEVKKIDPKPNCIEHTIKTIDDLYQVATIENIEKLTYELRCAMQLCLTMELTANVDREAPYKKVTMTQFRWTDD